MHGFAAMHASMIHGCDPCCRHLAEMTSSAGELHDGTMGMIAWGEKWFVCDSSQKRLWEDWILNGEKTIMANRNKALTGRLAVARGQKWFLLDWSWWPEGERQFQKDGERWIKYQMTKNNERITSIIAHIKHLLGNWLSLEGRTEFLSMGNEGLRGRVRK